MFETAICSIRSKHFVFRGFLIGPWCPIYGTAAVIILATCQSLVESLSDPNVAQWPAVFVASFITATFVEWAVSGILQKFYGFGLWSYKNRKFNIQGRVALMPSMAWGLLGVVLIFVINLPIWAFADSLLRGWLFYLAIGVILLFVIDFIASIVRLGAFRKLTRYRRRNKGKDITDDYAKFVDTSIRNKWIPNIRKFIARTIPNDDLLKIIGFKKPKSGHITTPPTVISSRQSPGRRPSL
jgi:uncharacterized membrane protein